MDFCRWFTVPGQVTHGTCVSSINVRLWACNLSATIRHPGHCSGMSTSLTQRLCLFFGGGFVFVLEQFPSKLILQVHTIVLSLCYNGNMRCLSSDACKDFLLSLSLLRLPSTSVHLKDNSLRLTVVYKHVDASPNLHNDIIGNEDACGH